MWPKNKNSPLYLLCGPSSYHRHPTQPLIFLGTVTSKFLLSCPFRSMRIGQKRRAGYNLPSGFSDELVQGSYNCCFSLLCDSLLSFFSVIEPGVKRRFWMT